LLIGSAGLPLLIVVVALVSGRSTSPVTWFLARGSGITLYLLIWAAVVLGLGVTTGLLDRLASRAVIYSLHRFVAALAYGFLSVHLVSLFIDDVVRFDLVDLVVPFAAGWGEPWTGLGVLAMYLFLLIGASSALLRRLPYRWWRGVHWLTFPLWVLALAHGVGAGTDTGASWAVGMYAGSTLVVVFLGTYRVLRGKGRMARRTFNAAAAYDRMSIRSSRT
jgi:predicted ferric reductase